MTEPDEFKTLHRLIKKGDVLGLKKSIASGVNINLRNQYGWTPLMIAAGEGDTSVLQLLISSGAEVDATNDFGASPLAYAALDGRFKALQLLLDAGAPIDVRPHGQSLLEFAGCGGGRFETQRHFELLRSAGAE